jgi:hypothetical protein
MRTCASRCSNEMGGITLRTIAMAEPVRMPVSRPAASRWNSPFAGGGVASVMPASFSARLLASASLPSNRLTNTGWFGVTASIRSRCGVNRDPPPAATCRDPPPPASPCPHCSYAPHSPRVIQLPAGMRVAAPAIRCVKSAGSWTSSRFTPSSRAPVLSTWTWASLNPGSVNAPPRSITRARALTASRASAFVPTARMRSPRIARASAHGWAGLSV